MLCIHIYFGQFFLLRAALFSFFIWKVLGLAYAGLCDSKSGSPLTLSTKIPFVCIAVIKRVMTILYTIYCNIYYHFGGVHRSMLTLLKRIHEKVPRKAFQGPASGASAYVHARHRYTCLISFAYKYRKNSGYTFGWAIALYGFWAPVELIVSLIARLSGKYPKSFPLVGKMYK